MKQAPRHGRDLPADAGLSLVEVLVVLAIISIAYVVAVPSVHGPSRGVELRAIAQDLTSHLRAARATAIGRGRPVAVAFDVRRRSYVSETDGRLVQLPADLSITVTAAPTP